MSALTKRMSNLLKRTPTDLATSLEKKEAPETRAPRLIKDFCDASSENSSAADEVIYLPYIRESVEANPQAAKNAVKAISKYIGSFHVAKPGALYNAIMLLRILADSPGTAFTQHLDDRFVGSLRAMLKTCNKQEPQLILQQTLEYFQREKSSDPHLSKLITMWQSQKNEWEATRRSLFPPVNHAQNYQQPAPPRPPQTLPPPNELVERIAEADTSVQLLTQFLQTTPQEELLSNDLIREFTNRCKSARDSMQAYIDCTNPAPDGDTLMTLVQTQQRISAVLNKRNVAVSQARAAFGDSPSPVPSRQQSSTQPIPQVASVINSQANNTSSTTASTAQSNGTSVLPRPPVIPPLSQLPQPLTAPDPAARLENPFDDSHQIGTAAAPAGPQGSGALGASRDRPALSVATGNWPSRKADGTGSNPTSKPASAVGSGTTALPSMPADTTSNNKNGADEGVDRNRFRIV